MSTWQQATTEERFWKYTDVSGGTTACWPWTASTLRGYGQLKIGSHRDGTRKTVKVHRLSWELHHGKIPDGLFVCHRCDNPICVNPAHLFLGTPADNTRDMRSKGRAHTPPRGTDVHTSKLSESDVREIKKLTGSGPLIARQYGVSPMTIYLIRWGRTWTHVQ